MHLHPQRHPVVPVFADISIRMLTFVSSFPSYDAEVGDRVFGSEDDHADRMRYMLLAPHWADMRAQHADMLRRLTSTTLTLSCQVERAHGALAKVPLPLMRHAVGVFTAALQLLSEFSSRVLEQSAVKHAVVGKAPDGVEASLYERAVRYNYSADELSVLVDVCDMVKSLSAAIAVRAAALARACLCLCICVCLSECLCVVWGTYSVNHSIFPNLLRRTTKRCLPQSFGCKSTTTSKT